LGVVDSLFRRGDLEKAEAECLAAAGASPEVANVYLKLAEISAKQKNWDASIRYCDTARRLAPYTHPSKVLLAVFCLADNEPDRGLKLLQEARRESPAHPVPPLMLGQLARRQRMGGVARENYAAASALPIPDSWPESHRQRFLVLLHSERLQLAQQLQDIGLARDALEQWLRYEPGNRQVRKMYDELVAGAPR
jgi:predicted Zn-dependent protease